MKILLSAVFLIIVATLFIKEGVTSCTPDATNPANARVDSLIKAYHYTFDNWSIRPYYGIQWVNGKKSETAYLQAAFISTDGGLLADSKKLNEFSNELVDLVAEQIQNTGDFQEMKVQFEERKRVLLFTSTNTISYRYLLAKTEIQTSR